MELKLSFSLIRYIVGEALVLFSFVSWERTNHFYFKRHRLIELDINRARTIRRARTDCSASLSPHQKDRDFSLRFRVPWVSEDQIRDSTYKVWSCALKSSMCALLSQKRLWLIAPPTPVCHQTPQHSKSLLSWDNLSVLRSCMLVCSVRSCYWSVWEQNYPNLNQKYLF